MNVNVSPTEESFRQECPQCGAEMNKEEIDNPYRDTDGDLLCDECYHDRYEYTCCMCGNYEHIDNEGDYLVLFEKCGGLVRGVYRIKSRPYYTSNYFDMWWNLEALEKVRGLPWKFSESEDGYPSGTICWGCRNELGLGQLQISVGRDPVETRPE
jgi:hypothetical protein